MKKPVLFLSDFDGTMTLKDFYHIYTKTTLKELDVKLLGEYKNREITSFEYLAGILGAINESEETIQEAIDTLPVDPMVKSVFDLVSENGGDCAVVSAGADYYIRPILDRIGLKHVPLYANRGHFQNRGITLSPPSNPAHYSKLYGIAKDSILNELKKQYEMILYVGDGTADFNPARLADIRFAKDVCAFRLSRANIDFIPFHRFDSIYDYLKNNFFPFKY